MKYLAILFSALILSLAVLPTLAKTVTEIEKSVYGCCAASQSDQCDAEENTSSGCDCCGDLGCNPFFSCKCCLGFTQSSPLRLPTPLGIPTSINPALNFFHSSDWAFALVKPPSINI